MLHSARSYVEISRSRIAANYRAARDLVGPATRIIGVVKADAYGHGAVEVARVLAAEGIEWLAVSSVEEGVALRIAGLTTRILTMAGVMAWERGAVVEFGLTPVIHSLSELREFPDIPVHLKLDTGLSRLGTRASAVEIAAALKGVQLEGLLSHFASAADFSTGQSEEQIGRFHAMVEDLAASGIHAPLLHLSSTNAVAYPRPGAGLSLVRPGHAIYGYVSPARGHAIGSALAVKPALSWYARIVAVKDVPAGALIGYGGSYKAERPMRLAVLAAGYADGVPHRLSNKGKVIAGGKFAPIVGTVSMDLTTIDVTASPELAPGDAVTLLGAEGALTLDAQQIAKTAGTISYNVLCGIGGRVKRFYVD